MNGIYKDGEQQGRWNYYDGQGKLINILTFRNGVLVENQIKT
jgi:antitoxin component YwqK of YwqJK toxin-antitoxin module